jgi:hypothetical protein
VTEYELGGRVGTEQEWLGCADPTRMLRVLRFKPGVVRKLRLFAVACHRREWHRLDDQTRLTVEFAEQLANDREEIAARSLRAAKEDTGTNCQGSSKTTNNELPFAKCERPSSAAGSRGRRR